MKLLKNQRLVTSYGTLTAPTNKPQATKNEHRARAQATGVGAFILLCAVPASIGIAFPDIILGIGAIPNMLRPVCLILGGLAGLWMTWIGLSTMELGSGGEYTPSPVKTTARGAQPAKTTEKPHAR